MRSGTHSVNSQHCREERSQPTEGTKVQGRRALLCFEMHRKLGRIRVHPAWLSREEVERVTSCCRSFCEQ